MRLRAITCVMSMLGFLLVALVSAPSAHAGTCSADKAGKTRKLYTNVNRAFTMTEAYRVEVSRGTEFHDTVTWQITQTRQNSVKMNAEVSTSVKAGIFGGAEVKVGGEFGTHNTKSIHYAQSQSWDITKPGVYYIARGFETFSTKITMQRCRRPHIGAGPNDYSWITYNYGTVKGFGKVVAATRCADSYPAGTFRRFVKAKRC
jgi:hypothetical protein